MAFLLSLHARPCVRLLRSRSSLPGGLRSPLPAGAQLRWQRWRSPQCTRSFLHKARSPMLTCSNCRSYALGTGILHRRPSHGTGHPVLFACGALKGDRHCHSARARRWQTWRANLELRLLEESAIAPFWCCHRSSRSDFGISTTGTARDSYSGTQIPSLQCDGHAHAGRVLIAFWHRTRSGGTLHMNLFVPVLLALACLLLDPLPEKDGSRRPPISRKIAPHFSSKFLQT